MHRNNPVEAELMPSADMILRAGVDEKTLNRLVQQKVAEIMAERDVIVFEPFFRSRQIAYELKRLQTVPEQRKWTVYFDRYGCLPVHLQSFYDELSAVSAPSRSATKPRAPQAGRNFEAHDHACESGHFSASARDFPRIHSVSWAERNSSPS